MTNDTKTLPELTTVDEVLRLKPEEAQRGYPVNLRGVVTCVVQEHNAFIVQDEHPRGLCHEYLADHGFAPNGASCWKSKANRTKAPLRRWSG